MIGTAAILLIAMNPPTDTLPRGDRPIRHESPAGAIHYRLHVPASIRPEAGPPPLVVMLHGCTQDAADFAAGTGMNRIAGERGFLVLYPEQPDSLHPQRCWRWYDPEHQERGAGEPAVLADLVGAVVREHGADPARVYAAGISAGGAMTAVLANAYPEMFAAVAVHSGAAYGVARTVEAALRVMGSGPPPGWSPPISEAAARTPPVPLLAIHGDADAVLSSANLGGLEAQWTAWAEAAGLLPELAATGPHRARVLADGEVIFESWLVPGLGHAWSGGSPQGTYTAPGFPDATTAIADFLLARRRSP